MSAHTTAVPCAIASTTGMPNPSCRLGNANRSAPANSANSCSRSTGPSSRTRSPSDCAASESPSSGFHPGGPASTSRCGTVPGSSRANASSSTRTFLRGWKVPAQNTYGRSSIPKARRARSTSASVAGSRSTPLGTTRIRSRGIGVCVAISSALNSDTAITRRARFGRSGEALTVERDPPAGERLGHHERRGVVHGDDQGHASRSAARPATARARGRPARPAGRDRRRRARARRRTARPRAVGGSPASRRRASCACSARSTSAREWRAVNAVTSTPRPGSSLTSSAV